MNPMSFPRRSSAIAASVGSLLLVAACAAAKPPVADAPPRPTPPSPAPAALPSAGEPTTGTIAIADDIRTACGIPASDALFGFDSVAIETTDIKPLDAVARCFTSGPLAGRVMRLIGHADPRGASDYNMTLGQRRADSVDGYIGRRGVQQSRMVTTSRGAMDATGQDEPGWAHDRRVDVQLGS
jgi:peptidoglycan-associated lipoprotein